MKKEGSGKKGEGMVRDDVQDSPIVLSMDSNVHRNKVLKYD